MSTSPPSSPQTVLLWGEHWWFADGTSCAFDDSTQAADMLRQHLKQESSRLRLVYQPVGFQSTSTACPHGSRNVIASALAADFPTLGRSDLAWSHEPVFASGDGYSTVLHLEAQPKLFALVGRLQHLGIEVDSVWPLATFLHALPEEWSDTGAVTVVAVRSHCAVAYRHPTKGVRSVESWQGESTVAEVGQWLGSILTENTSEPLLVITTDDDTAAWLSSYLGEGERPGLEWRLIGDALNRPTVLPRNHPAQLLPRGAMVTPQRMAIAASLALLLASAWSALNYGRGWVSARADSITVEQKQATLRTEVAHLRSNAQEILSLRRLVEAGNAHRRFHALLGQIAGSIPPEISLAEVQLTDHDIAITGWVAPSANNTLLSDWTAQLAPENSAWAVDATSKPNGGFALTGAFKK